MESQSESLYSFTRSFTQNDFDRFAALSGDDNPIHVDPEFSRRTKFGRTVAHGMLLYSTICSGLSRYFPGGVQVGQELIFPSPTYVDETVEVQLEAVGAGTEAGSSRVSTTIIRPDGELSCQGMATLVDPSALDPKCWAQAPQSAPGYSEVPEFKGLAVGQSATTRRDFTQGDLLEYSRLTGDLNPLYTERAYALSLGFNEVILPGGLLGGMISYLLGTKLPGRGTNWLKQKFSFIAPAYVGQEITSRVEITRLREDKQLVNLACACLNPADEILVVGEALVLVKDLESQ